MNIKRYKKSSDYSYTLGVFPTLELLKHKYNVTQIIYIRSNTNINKGIQKIKVLCNKHKIRLEVDDKMINKLSSKENVYAVGIFNKYESELETDKDHVVLVNPSNMGNLGTIMRTMLGFGVKNLGIIQPGVDVFHPESIRSSMGSIFQMNSQYFNSFDEYTNKFTNRNRYLFMTDGKESLPKVKFQSPYTLVFGPEGSGLPANYHQYGASIRIPQSEEIDSFNLAISTGIALYETYKQNAQ